MGADAARTLNGGDGGGDGLPASFLWLNATQFLGALNDNIFKLLTTFFLIAQLGAAHSDAIVGVCGIVFALPFLLFQPAAGVLADRVSKRSIVVWAKVLEVAVMLGGAAALALGSSAGAIATLFMMSAQSALFGPSKYGIIPELVRRDQLSRANGALEAATFLAITIGSALGPLVTDWSGGRWALAAGGCVAVAALGVITSLGVRRTPPAGSTARASWFSGVDVWRTMRAIRGDRQLVHAVWGVAFFTLIAAYLQLSLIPFGMRHLGLTETRSGYLFVAAAIGIGAGSLLAGRLSGRHIEFGLVPLGALGLALSALGLGAAPVSVRGATVVSFLAGVSAGLFSVPLEAFIQYRGEARRRGSILAAKGFISWAAVLVASGLLTAQGVAGVTPRQGLAAIGALTLLLLVASVAALPDFLVRFAAMVLTRTFYRLRVLGLERVPAEGGALLVSNHVTFMDALQILSTQPRRIRFVMNRRSYDIRWLNPIFRLMGAIPISKDDPPRRIVESIRRVREEMDAGFLVCVFAEGALTRTGQMREFREGLERMIRGTAHPIVPVYLGGTWGSIFSHYYGHNPAGLPRRLPYPMTVAFGPPLPPDTPAWRVRLAVMELSCEYFEDRRRARPRSLALAFAGLARRRAGRPAIADSSGLSLTFGQTLTAALALARVLRPAVGDARRVGVLLPPSVGGALANVALALLGRAAVNLNFTVSQEAFRSALRQAGIRTIVTADAFLEKFPAYRELPGLVTMEQLRSRLTPGLRLGAWLASRALPARWLARRAGGADDPATIVFSSGTTGDPKGVTLSNHNILSNIESVALVLRPRPDDALAATLPLFHSFGYTCGLWLPLVAGLRAAYHASPLDAGRVGELVRDHRCTALFTTPTFLLAYIRRVPPEQFRTLRVVVSGAEKLKPRIAEAFEKRFGFPPLEGFGATELSPVACLSLPDVDVDGIYQAGHKPGSVGQPVPGVAVRIVDPDTGALRPPGEPGLMIVRGPNVMLGYLGRPDLTAEAVRDGWYRTGDLATMDEEGFVSITDRLARFSKIGGEMVPHGAVEDEYLRGLGRADQVVAVTSIPDDRRGERLVVVHSRDAADAARLCEIVEKSGLPNLWRPDRDAYVAVDALPLTGSGKLDIKALKSIAREAVGGG